MVFSVIRREERRAEAVELRVDRTDDFVVGKAEEERDAEALETY